MKFRNRNVVYSAPSTDVENTGGGAAPEAGQVATKETTTAPASTSPTQSAPSPTQPVAAEQAVAATTTQPAPKTAAVSYDPATKQLGDMLISAGVNPQKAREAVQANNGQCTPEIFAALELKHGAGMAALLSSQMGALNSAADLRNKQADTMIYTQIEEAFKGVTEQSGQETWTELSTWAKENIENDQRKELNEAIAQGGLVAKLAIQELINVFQQSGDYTQEMIGIEGDNSSTPIGSVNLSRSEYTKQLNVLLENGHDYNGSQEISKLNTQRARSIKRGY